MEEILAAIDENADDKDDKRFNAILARYGFSDYAPSMSASAAFTDLVDCYVGDERAGGAGVWGYLLSRQIFVQDKEKIDIGIEKVIDFTNELRASFLEQ
jgi:hypothetical protein